MLDLSGVTFFVTNLLLYGIIAIMKILKYITKGIRNLIYWLPVIWMDRHWDHYYLSIILRHKLKDMEKFYKSDNAWGLEAPKLAEQMKTCVTILDRIIKDDYNREGYDDHDEKWGELKFTINENGALTIFRENRNLNEELEKEEYKKVWQKEERDRDVDIENLFKIMRENLRKWWD